MWVCYVAFVGSRNRLLDFFHGQDMTKSSFGLGGSGCCGVRLCTPRWRMLVCLMPLRCISRATGNKAQTGLLLACDSEMKAFEIQKFWGVRFGSASQASSNLLNVWLWHGFWRNQNVTFENWDSTPFRPWSCSRHTGCTTRHGSRFPSRRCAERCERGAARAVTDSSSKWI